MSDVTFKIEIPADNDGFVLFKCPLCGDFFKIKPDDYEDEGVLNIYCPSCGQISENYLTDDVIELATTIAENYANDLIYNEIKKWERKFSNNVVKFNAGKRLEHKYESPIRATIEALLISNFTCCSKKIKIKPLHKICGCYCPFCGVKNYGVE